jgi:hypothetical protein
MDFMVLVFRSIYSSCRLLWDKCSTGMMDTSWSCLRSKCHSLKKFALLLDPGPCWSPFLDTVKRFQLVVL